MAGVNTILRVIGAILSLIVFIFIGWTGVMLYDPITSSHTLPQLLYYAGVALTGVVILYVAFSALDARTDEYEPPDKRTCELCGDKIDRNQPHVPIEERKQVRFDYPWPFGSDSRIVHGKTGYAHVECFS